MAADEDDSLAGSVDAAHRTIHRNHVADLVVCLSAPPLNLVWHCHVAVEPNAITARRNDDRVSAIIVRYRLIETITSDRVKDRGPDPDEWQPGVLVRDSSGDREVHRHF